MKRIIALLLTALMICAMTVPAYAQSVVQYASSTLSAGSVLIVVLVALIAVLAVIYFVVKSKKNKK